MSTNSCIIEKVEAELSPLSPILVNFEENVNPCNESGESPCDMYLDPENYLKRKLLFVTKTDQKLVANLLPLNDDEDASQTYVLIRNKKTNKARLTLVQSCNFIKMSKEESRKRKGPRVSVSEHLKKKVSSNNSFSSMSYEEKRLSVSSFHTAFGSKKAKKASAVGSFFDLNLSKNENEVKETVSKIDLKLNDVNQTLDGNEELMQLIPPCDRDATTAMDVYNVDDIISETEKEALRLQAESLISNGLTENDEKCSIFMYMFYSAIDPTIENVILLIYANSLVQFCGLPATELKNSDIHKRIHPTSRPVAMRILNDFTILSKGGRTRTNFLKDKLLCYLMVILLFCSDNKINLEKLSSCLRGFSYKRLLQLARLVGLVPQSKSNKIYSIKVPLPPLPKPRLKKRN